eukprot:CFRG7077T1
MRMLNQWVGASVAQQAAASRSLFHFKSTIRCMAKVSKRSTIDRKPVYGKDISVNSTENIRQDFLDYFSDNGHTEVASSALVPTDDSSLHFTNAGMVQFKPIFLNERTPPYDCAVTVQKCMRAGGKHNDLDNVGYTPRHHTFFEMLGNFSFGKYQRTEAIRLAWDYLTARLKLPTERLYVTTHVSDAESYKIWTETIGVCPTHVSVLDKDNWWAMGEVGPCGPSTEIFWDLGEKYQADDRKLEIWNVVFMEFNQQLGESGSDNEGVLSRLPQTYVDTGMGLERIASVLQGMDNNYDTDNFSCLVSAVKALVHEPAVSKPGTREAPYRIIADHLRASAFLISDGVMPSNQGRGYVLRRIIRRACLAARQINLPSPFFEKLYPALLITLPERLYPNIHLHRNAIANLLSQEELGFVSVLEKGMERFNQAHKAEETRNGIGKKVWSPSAAFHLYERYGLPVDVTMAMARSHGYSLDVDAVDQLIADQRTKSRRAYDKGQEELTQGPTDIIPTATVLRRWGEQGIRNNFIGHTQTHSTATVKAVHRAASDDGTLVYAVIDPCPFYGEAGGQVGDTGTLTVVRGNQITNLSESSSTTSNIDRTESVSESASISVTDTLTPHRGMSAIEMSGLDGCGYLAIEVGDTVNVCVDVHRRQMIAQHHTATHCLHASLRKVLGDHVLQAGSLVEPTRLRFDFTHSKALTSKQIHLVEDMINTYVSQPSFTAPTDSDTSPNTHTAVSTRYMPYLQAIHSGAMALFGENYDETVRVVSIGGASGDTFSTELCGGSHVAIVTECYPFRILSESAVAAGTRRIEAVVGRAAVQSYQNADDTLSRIKSLVKSPSVDNTEHHVVSIQSELKATKKEVTNLIAALAATPQLGETVTAGQWHDAEIKVHVLLTTLPSKVLRARAVHLAKEDSKSFHVCVHNDRVVVARGDDLRNDYIHSGRFMKLLVEQFEGGKGGGGPGLAEGSITSRCSAYELQAMLKSFKLQN